MSSNSISIKPNNHRVHPCPNNKKLELLNKLISENSEADIIVVSSNSTELIKEKIANKEISVLNDKEFITSPELSCEFLISYDLPDSVAIYIARVAKATDKAVVLLDKDEQKQLHPIEMQLGRAIKQDVIDGFEYEVIQKKEQDPRAPKKLSKEQIKEVAKKRYDEKTGEPKPKKEYKDRDKKDFKKDDKWAKKEKAPNKFLGKDENGKAIFSGKSGDRNHRYDGTPKDKYNAPKKVGRKINIKALKKSEDK